MSLLSRILEQYFFPESDIEAVEDFTSRDGFELIEKKEFTEILNFFKQNSNDFGEIIPLMTDNQSNYICTYIKGEYKFTVCYLNHDEINLYPKFKNISDLIKIINDNPDCWDITEFEDSVFI